MIVRKAEPITLVGGGEVSDSALGRAMGVAPFVVAADSGADRVLARGVMPEAVIGDFDSISAGARIKIPENNQHVIAEQDSTDFEKCLRNIEAPLIVGVGFCGARLDHQLAACNALVRNAARRCVLLGQNDLVFLAPPSVSLNLAAGTSVSLFPMGAVEGVSDGLKWPIAGLNFAPDGGIGTSNRATGPVQLTVTAPKLLVLLPLDTLDDVMRALLETPAGWD